MRASKFLTFLALICLTACQKSPLERSGKTETASESISRENSAAAPPFATKEPDKYQARLVFSFKYNENAANVVEQTTFVARDGAQRRMDFELGDGTKISRLVAADNKHFVLLPERKVFAELAAGAENFVKNAPDDFTLEHLLHAKPAGAAFERVGAEEIAGRATTKYRIVFDKVIQSGDTATETLVWADESLGLPVRTEIFALVDGKPTGAKSTLELSEIKTETDAQTFALPAGYRKISPGELQEIIKPK